MSLPSPVGSDGSDNEYNAFRILREEPTASNTEERRVICVCR